jgi:hypothetical protein
MENSRGSDVRIDIVRVEVTPTSAEIKVGYVLSLKNKVYEGAVAGGETQFSNETLGSQLLELVEKMRVQIEQDLGLASPVETTEDEDPL